MSEMAKRLRDRRQNVWEQAKELADRAAEENRAFSAEEQGQWDALNEELNNLDSRIKSALDTEKRAKEADEAFEKLAGSGGQVAKQQSGAPAGVEQELDAQFRALGNGERRNVTVALPNAFERRALLGHVEQRAPVLTSNVPLPTTFIGQLYNYLVDTSSIRQANPRVYTTSSGENLEIPRSTDEGEATWTGEGVALTESNPTIDSVTLSAYKVGKIIYVSSELLADTGFDLLGFIAEHAGRNIGLATDAAYVNGDGTAKPSGLVGAATVGHTGAGAVGGAVAAADLFELFHSVIPPYRSRSSWLMNDQTVKGVRQLRDGSGGTADSGNFLWQPGLQAGEPDRLLGRPVYPDPNMPAVAVDAKSIAFGDFGGYWIRDVSPLRFDRSDDFKFDTDVVSFRVLYRTDGKLGDVNAVKVFQGGGTTA